MRISTRGRYGLRAMLDLAMNEEGGRPVPLAEISMRQGISLTYLEQIFNRLRRGGLVASKQGAGGGYALSSATRDITVGDVIRCLEGPIAPVACAAAEPAAVDCSRASGCITRTLWMRLGAKIENFFDSISLKELCDEEREMRKKQYVPSSNLRK
jgi:Rrf2 family protein